MKRFAIKMRPRGKASESRSIDQARDLGDRARDEGNWADAVTHYERHLVEHARDFAIWVQLGHALKESGNLNGALRAYTTALGIDNRDADLLLNIGHLFKVAELNQNALEFYEKSFSLDNNDGARLEIESFDVDRGVSISRFSNHETYKRSVDNSSIQANIDEARSENEAPLSAAGLPSHDHLSLYSAMYARSRSAEVSTRNEAEGDLEASVQLRYKNSVSSLSTAFVAPRTIAFYLPQYHRVKENDEWWGSGFTEWTNVRKAAPNFLGHEQPHVPGELGYYDLSGIDVQRRQFRLAQEYGIYGFCYYMYWFDGRRILERPLDNIINNKDLEHRFCICWANENWTRTWDGKEKDILIGQRHTPESDKRFIMDAIKYLSDDRYIRVEGKPMLLVYRVDLLPDSRATAHVWREEALKAGLGELHLCAVQFYGVESPIPWGFDAAVEFPPHGWLGQENLLTPTPNVTNAEFKGTILDYDKAISFALSKPVPNYRRYRGCFPGWDNTARRQNNPHIFHGNTPFSFQKWYQSILEETILMAPPEDQIVFINAWNEWGEGAHLEPCQQFGRLNLQAVHSALSFVVSERNAFGVLNKAFVNGGYIDRDQASAILERLRSREMSNRALAFHLRSVRVNPMETS